MRIGRRTSTLGAALLAGVLVLAACGGDDGASSADTTAAAAATTASGSGSAGTTAAGGTATTADDSADTSASFSGEGGEAFCTKLKEFEDSPVLNGDPNLEDPAAVREQYEAIEDAINQLSDVAPDEIQADIDTLKSSLGELIDLFKEYDYDLAKLNDAAQQDPALMERFQNAGGGDETAAASDRLAAYGEQICGVTDTTAGG
jgi:hypothetical protein